jgi:hypothetical protein
MSVSCGHPLLDAVYHTDCAGCVQSVDWVNRGLNPVTEEKRETTVSDEVQKRIQGKLAAARQLLIEAGTIADEEDIEYVQFLGLTYERMFGWFKADELVAASEWNASECVIGSELAEGRGPGGTQWQSSSWCLDG